jgi:hypothetical protein
VLLGALALSAAAVGGDEPRSAEDQPLRFTLVDGGTLVGTVVAEDDAAVTVRTASGAEIRVPRSAIASRAAAPRTPAPSLAASGRATDPNESRLMFAPTARPLGKGNGYFSDHYVLFPGIAYGLTSHLTVAGGFSMIPGASFADQVFYASATSGWKLGSRSALAVGGFLADASEDTGVGFAALFGVATFGPPDGSLSVGIAAVAEREEEYRYAPSGEFLGSERTWRAWDAPIVMFGGSARLGKNLSLIGESWLLLGDDFTMSEQPFGFALRFFNGRISADVGVVLIGEALENGLPVPWLSLSWHFGPSRSESSSRKAGPVTPAWVPASARGRR